MEFVRPFRTVGKLNDVERLKLARHPLDVYQAVIDRYSKAGNFEEIIPISALSGENVENLVAQILIHLPEGPLFYPADQISDQPERAIAAEMIREKLILLTEEEMPYSTAVVIDRFEEGETIHRIYASIFVERDSQKAIIIGKAGQKLKQVGIDARKDHHPRAQRGQRGADERSVRPRPERAQPEDTRNHAHDPALETEFLPTLRHARRLAGLAPDSDEARLAGVDLVRGRNAIVDALRRAQRRVESCLAELGRTG